MGKSHDYGVKFPSFWQVIYRPSECAENVLLLRMKMLTNLLSLILAKWLAGF